MPKKFYQTNYSKDDLLAIYNSQKVRIPETPKEYPIIKFPKKIQDIQDIKKSICPTTPIKPPYPTENGFLAFISVALLFTGFLSIIAGFNIQDSGGAFAYGFITVPIGFLIFSHYRSEEKRKQELYDKLLIVYNKDTEDYKKAKAEYDKLTFLRLEDKYKNMSSIDISLTASRFFPDITGFSLTNWALGIGQSDIEEIRNTYRKEKFKEIFQSIPIPEEYPNSFSVGHSEQLFKLFLKNAKLNVLESRAYIYAEGVKPYVPDIIVNDPETGLYIDVEIDEPYILTSKEPIHYFGCGDTDRDDFFLEENWCVIRFAEIQIIKNKDECLRLIQQIIDCFRNGDIVFDISAFDLWPIKQWSKKQSIEMAKNNFRNYLQVGS